MSQITRVRQRCSVKGCPWPYDPEKHVCWARNEPWHSCDGSADHQHEPRRSKGKASRISAILCRTLHRAIDAHEKHNGRYVRNYLAEVWAGAGCAECGGKGFYTAAEIGRCDCEAPGEEYACPKCAHEALVYVISDRETGEVLLEVPLIGEGL